MDTTAYLTRHGWLGAGHSLHPSGHGIKKPLLVSKKLNVLGVGKKQHDVHADQWWARAFDATLKDLNINTDGPSGKLEEVTFGTGAKQLAMGGRMGRMGGKWAANGGLYGAFIRGQGLDGTISPETVEETRGNREDSVEEDNVGGKRKRSRGEQGQMNRRRKEKSSSSVELQAPDLPSVVSATYIVIDPRARKEHRRKQQSTNGNEEHVDKDEKKLSKEARHKLRKEGRLQAAEGLESKITSANPVDAKLSKKIRRGKASAAG